MNLLRYINLSITKITERFITMKVIITMIELAFDEREVLINIALTEIGESVVIVDASH